MILSFTSKIWFYRDIVDFRKQLNGLIQLIVDCIEADPSSGELFIFRDRTGKKLKLSILMVSVFGFFISG